MIVFLQKKTETDFSQKTKKEYLQKEIMGLWVPFVSMTVSFLVFKVAGHFST